MRGGKRQGAGRKRGASTTKTRAVADQLMKDGRMSPLEIMIQAMADVYRDAGALAAFQLAKDVAPYLHPRLTSTDVGKKNETSAAEALRELAAKLPD